MKKPNNKKKNKSIKYLILLISCFVLFLALGYSSFSANLSIEDGLAIVRVDKNVRVTGITVDSTSNGGAVTDVEYTVDKVYADIRMPQQNSTVSFDVSVKNYGNVEMGIESITLPASLQNIFDVTITDYTLRDKIRDNNDTCESAVEGCTLSINRTIGITLSYKTGAYDSNNYTFDDLPLEIVFKEMHTITFTGFTILHPPKEARCVMDGYNYSYNIGPYDTLLVREGGVNTQNYTIDANNVISFTNVTDDMEIIISEIMIPVNITINPNTANIAYTLNGSPQTAVTGTLSTSVPIGSDIDIDVTAYGYKELTKHYDVDYNIIDSLTMDTVYYLVVNTDQTGTNIAYHTSIDATVHNVSSIDEEFDPGVIVYITCTKENYKTVNKSYTMNQHYNETIHMIRQYKYKAIPSDPAVQNFTLSENGGTAYSINANQYYYIDEDTDLVLTASADGYRTKTIPHNDMSGDITDTVTLTKTYTYTATFNTPAASATGASLKISVNDETAYSITSGQTYVFDTGTKIVLTASADGYRTQTITTNSLTSNTTKTVTLLKYYTFTLTTNVSGATFTLNNTGESKSVSGTTATIRACKDDVVTYNVTKAYYRNNSSLPTNNDGNKTWTMLEADKSVNIDLYQNIKSGTFEVITENNGLVVSKSSNGTRTFTDRMSSHCTKITRTTFDLERVTNNRVILDFLVNGSSIKNWSPSGVGKPQDLTMSWTYSGSYPPTNTFGVKMTNNQTIWGATLNNMYYYIEYAVE